MKRLFLLLTLILTVTIAAAEGRPVVMGERVSLQSELLGETREILLSIPSRSGPAEGDPLAVLVLLDGSSQFEHTAALVNFLVETRRIPPMLVVGIVHTGRTEELVPFGDASKEPDRFNLFGGHLQQELLPWIDANYRTGAYRVLVGHSLGGLFAVHTLIHKPRLFDAYIAVSPSLWREDQRIVGELQSLREADGPTRASLFISSANEGGAMLRSTQNFVEALRQDAPRGVSWTYQPLPQETHTSVPHRSIHRGLEKIFEGWALPDPLAYYEERGLGAVHDFYQDSAAKYGYERTTPRETLGYLGHHLLAQGRLDEVEAIIRLDPERFDVPVSLIVGLADAHLERGQVEIAMATYRRALDHNPGDTALKSRLLEDGIDVATLMRAPDVSLELMASYQGEYLFSAGAVLSVTFEDGVLFGEPDWGDPKARLHAYSESRFYVEGVDVQVTFERDATGRVKGLSLDYFGRSCTALREPLD